MPCINYFAELIHLSEIRLAANEKYIKQSYRNRAYILGPHKIESLTIPVHGSSRVTNMKDVAIDNHSKWQRTQWRTIEAAYKKAPFWEHYESFFAPHFKTQYNFLIDFNVSILTSCLIALGKNKPLCLVEIENNDEAFDLNAKERDIFHPKYGQERYIQNFGNDFVPNLSIIDLLMCQGPEAKSILQKTKLE